MSDLVQPISFDEVSFDPASVVDDVGRIFRWRGGVYRAVRKQYEDHCLNILHCKGFQSFLNAGLIETEVTPLQLEGYPLVLQHRDIKFRSYCMEWCSLMLKDAALMICELNIALSRQGYCTKDAHPWNVFFDFTKPIYIDFGSLIPLSEFSAHWPREFQRYMLLPLYLISRRLHQIGRRLLTLSRIDRFAKRLAELHLLQWVPFRYLKLEREFHTQSPEDFFIHLRSDIESLRVSPKTTAWSKYDQKPTHNTEELQPKQRTVYRLLEQISAKTLVDIGCNLGWYSELAVSLGYHVVAFDKDDAALCSLYRRAKTHNLPILPLMLDFFKPTPSHGLIGQGYPSAIERLICDVSLVLAMVHHLVFKQNLSFDQIAERISAFTRQYSIVEFIPKEDYYVTKWIWVKSKYRWYTMEQFITSMKRYFSKVSVFESSPPPRKILLFER